MKTFNEKDLITWTNKEKAVVGNEYYFANRFSDLKDAIKNEETHTLYKIDNNCIMQPFEINPQYVAFACLLPVEAVKEEEKKYRACKTIKEFSDVIDLSSLDSYDDSDYIYDLIDKTIHIRSKNTGTEYYASIKSISIDSDGIMNVLIGNIYSNFKDLFNNFEIEINGEWLPFGVEE